MGRRAGITVTRGRYDRAYTVRDATDGYLQTVNFREVEALAAVRAGKARTRLVRRIANHFEDGYLHPECDAFGVAHGTLSTLQFHGLVTAPATPAPLALTAEGTLVLDAVQRFVRAERRTLATAAAAAGEATA